MPNQTPTVILFDLDDTILDFSSSAAPCWQAASEEFACRLPGITPDQLLAAITSHRRWFWSDAERHRRGRLDMDAVRPEIVAGALLQLGITAPSVADEIASRFIFLREQQYCLFPEALETLHHLRGLGIKLGMITNGGTSTQRAKIERFALAALFDEILVEGEFGVGKPDERVFRHMLDRFQVTAAEVWMVGDDLDRDIAGAQQLGIVGIWHDVKGAGLPEASSVKPDRTIRELSEIL